MGCGASSSLHYDPTGPISLASFRVERVLGEGGFGKVKYVVKKDSDAGFAMKCMDKHTIVEKKHETMIFKDEETLMTADEFEMSKLVISIEDVRTPPRGKG